MGPPLGAGRRETVVNAVAGTAGTTPAPGVEWELATDMVRRALPLAPVPVALAAVFHGLSGALSAGYGLGLVLANLIVSAALMAWAARRSLGLLAGVAVGGFAVRLGLLTLAVWAVKDMGWVELVPLGLTVVVSQVGLLWWEARHLSLTLAYPGLKPPPGRS